MSDCNHRFDLRHVCQLCGRSKLEIYTEGVTPEMIAEAKAKLDRDVAFEEGRREGRREASADMLTEIDRVFG